MSDTSTPISILPKNDGQPIEIKFYGHSLSEADYSYFQSIFDFYNLYDNYNVSLCIILERRVSLQYPTLAILLT